MSNKLTQNTTFQTVALDFHAGDYEPWGLTWGEGTRISYLVSSDRIRIELDDGRTIDFDNEQPDGYPFAKAQDLSLVAAPGEDPSHQLLIAPVVAQGVELTYVRLGWYRTSKPVAPPGTISSTFLFGQETKSMPTTGTASYATSIGSSGDVESVLYDYSAASTATFSADFAKNEVSTLIHLIGAPLAGGASTDFGEFIGRGEISQAAFQGDFDNARGYFVGSFFGPEATEMGYNFWIMGYSTSVAAGGTVVGRKN